MGAVYEAMHVLSSKPVAVKVLRDKYLDRPEVAQRLVQEARLASSIRHEHIVDITDSGATDDGRTFVVMEHLDGLSLAELLKREGALPEARVIEIARQAASALGAAHERGIVHRDVKPENIFLVDRDGRDFVKVLDFGISKTLKRRRESSTRSRSSSRTPGMVLGTPLYMSPEQARGDEDLDQRIDIWALGVILYECLTAEVPFRATNYLGVIAQVLNQEVTPPRKLRPEMRISEAMERVVQKAMARDARRSLSVDGGARGRSRSRRRGRRGRAAAADAVDGASGRARRCGWRRSACSRARRRCWPSIASRARPRRRRRPLRRQPPPRRATPAPAPAAPKTMVLHVETTPPGAEIRQGSRVFGAAPRDILLAALGSAGAADLPPRRLRRRRRRRSCRRPTTRCASSWRRARTGGTRAPARSGGAADAEAAEASSSRRRARRCRIPY